MTAARWFLRAVSWAFGCSVLAALLLRPWTRDEFFLTRYTAYVMPWLLLLLVPGALLAVLRRQQWLALVLGASAAIIAIAHAPLFRSRVPPAPPSAASLRVMSYNTWSHNRDEAGIARVVLAHRPDILLLQEIPRPVFARLVDRIAPAYGGSRPHAVYDADTLQAVISRYPVESHAIMKRRGQAQKAVLRTPAGPVTVFNVHPLRRGGWRHRYGQIASLLEEEVLRESGAVILGGDFNVTERSQLFELISSHLRSAHGEAGSGFGFTYPASGLRLFGLLPALPVVRIDHIFFSDHFDPIRAATIADSGGSDHRPVFAEFAFRGHVAISGEASNAAPTISLAPQ